jgi:hypothetical protein
MPCLGLAKAPMRFTRLLCPNRYDAANLGDVGRKIQLSQTELPGLAEEARG